MVLAPTGVAAMNVGGATLHSFFRLPPRPIHPDEIKTLRSKAKRKLYQKIETEAISSVKLTADKMLNPKGLTSCCRAVIRIAI